MPCSQTPGTSRDTAHYRLARCCLLGYLNHRPSQTSFLTGLNHFNPKAYGLPSLCLRLAHAVARTDPRLDTECGGSPLLRRDFHPLGQPAPRGAQVNKLTLAPRRSQNTTFRTVIPGLASGTRSVPIAPALAPDRTLVIRKMSMFEERKSSKDRQLPSRVEQRNRGCTSTVASADVRHFVS
jgi:hypothetical protein